MSVKRLEINWLLQLQITKKNNPLSPEALANIKSKTLEREGVSVTVLNTQTNEVREFTSQTEAGEFLGVTRQAMGSFYSGWVN